MTEESTGKATDVVAELVEEVVGMGRMPAGNLEVVQRENRTEILGDRRLEEAD